MIENLISNFRTLVLILTSAITVSALLTFIARKIFSFLNKPDKLTLEDILNLTGIYKYLDLYQFPIKGMNFDSLMNDVKNSNHQYTHITRQVLTANIIVGVCMFIFKNETYYERFNEKLNYNGDNIIYDIANKLFIDGNLKNTDKVLDIMISIIAKRSLSYNNSVDYNIMINDKFKKSFIDTLIKLEPEVSENYFKSVLMDHVMDPYRTVLADFLREAVERTDSTKYKKILFKIQFSQ